MSKVVIIEKHGSSKELKIVKKNISKLKPNQVLIKNSTIGLNFIDIYHRTGLYPVPLPSSLGLESCGIIQDVGSKIKSLKAGDRVGNCTMPLGSYSENQIIDYNRLIPIPEYISDEVASAVMLKGVTSEYLLHRTCKVKKGDKILFHAAAGGLGQIFCQWARHLGCKVIGTVSSEHKEEIAKKNGCHHVINYKKHNFVKEVEKIVGKNGIDIVYDGVGLSTFEGSIECLKIRGTMVLFGNSSGYVRSLDITKHINKKSLFFTRPTIAHYTIDRLELNQSLKLVFEAINKNYIKINIFKSFDLSEVRKAHDELEARLLIGPSIMRC